MICEGKTSVRNEEVTKLTGLRGGKYSAVSSSMNNTQTQLMKMQVLVSILLKTITQQQQSVCHLLPLVHEVFHMFRSLYNKSKGLI